MPKQPEKKDLLKYRKEQMELAWELDGKTSASPFHKFWLGEWRDGWGRPKIEVITFDVHHLNNRDNTGNHDSVEWLISLSKLEHLWCETLCKLWKLTGEEYTYVLLYTLSKRDNFRWATALRLYEKKLTGEKISELQRGQYPPK